MEEPRKVTREFCPPPAAETVVHETPHQKSETNIFTSEKIQNLPSSLTSGEESNGNKNKKYKPWPKPIAEEIAEEKKMQKEMEANLAKIEKESSSKNWFKISIIILGAAFVLLCGIFIFMLYNGNFDGVFAQDISVNPNIQVDSPTANTFDVDPINNNNFTIVNEITCPVCVCNTTI